MLIKLRQDVIDFLEKGEVISNGNTKTYVTLQGSFETTSVVGVFKYKKSKINSLKFWQNQNK